MYRCGRPYLAPSSADRCGQEGKTGNLPSSPRAKMYLSGSICGRIETHNHLFSFFLSLFISNKKFSLLVFRRVLIIREGTQFVCKQIIHGSHSKVSSDSIKNPKLCYFRPILSLVGATRFAETATFGRQATVCLRIARIMTSQLAVNSTYIDERLYRRYPRPSLPPSPSPHLHDTTQYVRSPTI